jgi:TrmH family RNA methyltransferase
LTKKIVGGLLRFRAPHITQDYTKPTALVVGTEATGLTQEWRDATQNIIIPMQGEIDSMNVSVAAILIFAKRQRDFKITFQN